MNITTKDFPVVAAEATDEYPHGAFEVILSAPTLDRDGEVIDSKAFEPLPDHITFDTDHSMTCDSVVGSGTPYYAEDGTLRVKGGYCSDERSQTIRQKVAEGHIRTTSVTFMAAQRVKDDKGVDHIQAAELLNGTFTPVPANREAVVLSAKSIVARARRGMPDSIKSIIGSLEAQRDRVRDALEDAYPDGWVYLRGVLADTVVFDAWNGDECASYQQGYTDDGSVVTLTGDPVEVDVMEVVVPDADASRETDDVLKSTDDATGKATAEAAADPAAKSADEDVEFRARLSISENAARLAFGA